MSSIFFFLLILINLFIFILMNIFYYFREKKKIKKYLMKIVDFEKDFLKTIFNEYSDKEIILTKNHPITKNLLNVKIVFKKGDNQNNSNQLVCYLNKKVLDLIKKDQKLKDIYL
ncbi:MAG: hypothetical protein Q8783_00705 [Candidatus Phytoplasma stylosanthis]|uniref:hypothetical protein n=2 Tax=Candidatus Phytoplasma stylosanthis TaxID=2798314 RepID=UPI00293AA90E|nr:hypothetical protein [Candidatus Phytoplasma stylosanthis]MDV3173623.1 hypothetical protein [Candidatus Phytoplasma stylosanthis]